MDLERDLEREGYVKVAESQLSSGQKVLFWCPTRDAPTLHEVMLDVYWMLAQNWLRRQQGWDA